MSGRRRKAEPKHYGCIECSGSGWTVDYAIVPDANGRPVIESSPARRCDCALGRYGAVKDAERTAMEAYR